MQSVETRFGRVFVIRLDSGDDVLKSLEEAVAEHGVKNGVFLGQIGSVRKYRVHVVASDQMPPIDVFPEGEEPLDVLSLTGQVMNGRIHAHIGFSGTDETFGGHLEEGCEVLSFSCVWLAEALDVDLTDWDRLGTLA